MGALVVAPASSWVFAGFRLVPACGRPRGRSCFWLSFPGFSLGARLWAPRWGFCFCLGFLGFRLVPACGCLVEALASGCVFWTFKPKKKLYQSGVSEANAAAGDSKMAPRWRCEGLQGLQKLQGSQRMQILQRVQRLQKLLRLQRLQRLQISDAVKRLQRVPKLQRMQKTRRL